jgi:2'-5' RNA ligase
MRLFVALEIPEAVRREVARRIAGLRERLPRAKWVDPANLHLTLLFFGQVDDAKVPALAAALGEAFAKHPPLELRLADAGTFPPRRPARVAWIGMESPGDLSGLQADASAAAVEAIGFEPEERPFHPHVTLARCESWPRDAADKFVAAFPGTIGQPWTAERGVLMESKLSPRGAQYRVAAELPFRGQAQDLPLHLEGGEE